MLKDYTFQPIYSCADPDTDIRNFSVSEKRRFQPLDPPSGSANANILKNLMGTTKLRNENETKRNETKRNEIQRNETKNEETKRNEMKYHKTKRNMSSKA